MEPAATSTRCTTESSLLGRRGPGTCRGTTSITSRAPRWSASTDRTTASRCASDTSSTRESGLTSTSNIVWNYGHTTIPRHLRDIVITEYGIADVRGRPDKEVIAALLNIADSRFQPELLEKARRAGKIAQDYQIPPQYRQNTPGRLQARLAPYKRMGLCPDFPLGTDFTEEEIILGRVLKGLKVRLATKGDLMKTIVRAMTVGTTPDTAKPYLARLKLDQPTSQKEKMIQKLIVSELISGGYV